MPNQDTPRRTYQKDRIERVCEYDGVIFYVTASLLKHYPCKYCSIACRAAGRVTGEKRTCEVCGKEFYRQVKELERRPSRWCSVACSRIVQRRGEDRICRTCGKAFYVQNGHLKKSPTYGFYCSEKCKGPRVRELKYRGGPFRYGPNWVTQRELARERDGHTCQECGRKEGKRKLHVHHIVSRRTFGTDYIRSNDLSNLVTLCARCHIRVETIGQLVP